jgi:hypothetical protein
MLLILLFFGPNWSWCAIVLYAYLLCHVVTPCAALLLPYPLPPLALCSVLYSSATGASETQNMAYMTRLLPVGFKDRCACVCLLAVNTPLALKLLRCLRLNLVFARV